MKRIAGLTGLVAAGALGADLLVGGCSSSPVGCAPYEQMMSEPQPTLDARIHALSGAIIACYNATPSKYKDTKLSSRSLEMDIPFENGDLMRISASSEADRDDADFANKATDVRIDLLENSGNTVDTTIKYSLELDSERGGITWGASSDRATDYVKYSTITVGKLDKQGMPSDTNHVEADPYGGGNTYITDDPATITCLGNQLFADAKSWLRATTAGNVTPNVAEPAVTGTCVNT